MSGPIRDEWIPSLTKLQDWFDEMLAELQSHPISLNSVIADFKDFALRNGEIYQQLNEMLDVAQPPKPKDVDQMFQLFNLAIHSAPAYNEEKLVGRPVNAVIATSMQTPAGRAIFNNKEVNAYIKKMFDGWLSPNSLKNLSIPRHNDTDPDNPTNPVEFTAAYACDINDSYFGFKCWDDFFVRELKDNTVRPLPGPITDNTFITCACESHLYRIAGDVKLDDKFWIKDQAYSLRQMLNDDVEYANKFVDGTVFQTYLSPRDYHRWHSPVKGTVEKIVQIQGTYYSVYSTIDNDEAPNELSVGLLPHVATRVLIYIKPDNEKIGKLLCFIGIGMFEVSTCQVVVREGDKVNNGDELGMFHFGGSSHCLVFQKDAKIEFNDGIGYKKTNPAERKRVMVNSSIAKIKPN